MKKLTLLFILVLSFDQLKAQEYLAAAKLDRLWGYIDPEGNWVIQPTFKEATHFCEGLARVKEANKWGVINKTGQWVIQPTYTEIKDFRDGRATASIAFEKLGVIDTTGTWIVKPEYNFIDYYANGFARAKNWDGWVFFDKDGKVLSTVDFLRCESFHNGLARVEINNQWGYINTSGDLVIKAQFDRAGDFYQGLAWVNIKGKVGYINSKGKLIIDLIYDQARDFDRGLARVYGNRSWSFIDTTGKTVLTLEKKIREVSNFREGFARAKVVDMGFINRKGKLVVSPYHTYAKDFNNGLAVLKKNDYFGLIDTSGSWVIPAKYNFLSMCSNGLICASNSKGKCGFMDQKGNWKIEPLFDDIGMFIDVRKTNKPNFEYNNYFLDPYMPFGPGDDFR